MWDTSAYNPPFILEFVVFYTNQKILWDGMRLVCSFFWSFFFWNWKPRSILVTHVAHSGIRAKFFQAANRRVEYVYLYERTEKNWNNIFSMYFFLFLKVLLIPLIWHKYSSSFLYNMVSFKVSKTCNEWKLEKNSTCHVGKCKFRFSPLLTYTD